jgi:transcriptional antiterminator RfaH
MLDHNRNNNGASSLPQSEYGELAAQRWYVVQTRVHAESKATFHLRRQGFDTYLPRYLKKRRHARRVDTVAAPLFPRYLFVSVDAATQRWHSIRSTIGITRLVTRGDIPAVVPSAIIEGLKRREDPNGFIKLEQRSRFASGDKIRVREGAFADALGLFEGVSGEERVTILLDLLGRKARVVLDMGSIEAA